MTDTPNTYQQNSYQQLKQDQRRRIARLPLHFAYTEQQAKDLAKRLKIKRAAELRPEPMTGGVYLAEDEAVVKTSLALMRARWSAAIKADTDGTGFLYEMFLEEMRNTEYHKLKNVMAVIIAAKLPPDALNDPIMRKAFDNAERDYLKEVKEEQRGIY